MHNLYKTKYWLSRQFGGKNKWSTFQHNGVLFPLEYESHKIPIFYKGEKINLEPLAEEMATLYARYVDTDYIKNRFFKKNFWCDWKKILGKGHVIESLDECDFTPIYDYIIKEREKKKQMSKEEKDTIKKIKDEEEKKYKTAIVDGKEQPVGNFRIEPPGIFIGRGCHPKLGSIKRRIYPEDIIINIDKESPIPMPLEGHKWQKVIHDKTVEWLASWKDDITGKIKYVWLGAHSDFKAQSDMHKFDMARKLKKQIKKIREQNDINLSSEKTSIRQIATALYFIDNLALRVGNEKGEDEADTVGVTSLRVEHIELLDNNKVKLDFLGKDSVRYQSTIQVNDKVYKNLQDFTIGRNPEDELFNQIHANDLNKYLQSFMTDLTAKVFRTYNASNLFQSELKKLSKRFEEYEASDKINQLLDGFNKANAKVALLCNHQKNISKSFKDSLQKMSDRIKELKKKVKKAKNKESADKIKKQIHKLKAKKELKIELKNVSLGTSKINYIDPRITVAFMKKHNLPIDKIFSKTLMDKFKWAFEVDENYKF